MSRKPVPIFGVIRPRTKLLFKKKLKREGECLVFTGTRNKRGYGFVDVTYGNKRVRFAILTHRLAWVLANHREVPEDRMVCHRCNNPPCCEPKHLYLGTHKTNAADMVRAGRQAHTQAMLGRVGENHPRSRHSDAERRSAVKMRRGGASFKEIAAAMGCKPATASRWWRQRLVLRAGVDNGADGGQD